MFSKTVLAGPLVLVGTIAVAGPAIMDAADENTPAAPAEWPVNGGNHRGEHFSALDQKRSGSMS